MDDTSYSSNESNFLSPFAQFRPDAVAPTTHGISPIQNQDSNNTSLLDASISPIAFSEDYGEEDEESQSATAPYRKAIRDSLEASFIAADERSSLLAGGGVVKSKTRSGVHTMWSNASGENPIQKEHQLAGWNDGYGKIIDKDNKHQAAKTQGASNEGYYFPIFVCAASGLHFSLMALHDTYIWYLSFRLGYSYSQEQVSTWQIFPWISPSAATLDQFGAFVPWKVVQLGQYWRFASSAFTCTSLFEWGLVCWSWRKLCTDTASRKGKNNNTRKASLKSSWWWLYFCCVLTGQLWMTACGNPYRLVGGVSFGMCGILCATGVAKPQQRFVLYLTCTSLLLLDLLGTYTSIWGGVGASLFGWACYAVGWTMLESKVASQGNKGTISSTIEYERGELPPPKGNCRRWSGLFILTMWVVPTLVIAFSD